MSFSTGYNRIRHHHKGPNKAMQFTALRPVFSLIVGTTFYSQPRAFSDAGADLVSR